MPQQSLTSSSRKKKAGHKPAHQNTFAYRHNPNSKRTQQILSSPNVGLCRRCHAKIEWRKQYRKYKPLTQPSTCNICFQRHITAAYHTICDTCAVSPVAYDKMMASMMDKKLKLEDHTIECNNDNNDNMLANINGQNHNRITIIVCAMCVKEPALTDDSSKSHTQEIMQTKINAQVERKEKVFGRALRLREMKAVERNVIEAFKEERERLRAEKRRTADADSESSGENNNGEVDDDDEDCVELSSQSDEDNAINDLDSDNDFKELDDHQYGYVCSESPADNDEEDPFLKAVGGAQNLLVGDAYRQRLLEKERQQQTK